MPLAIDALSVSKFYLVIASLPPDVFDVHTLISLLADGSRTNALYNKALLLAHVESQSISEQPQSVIR